jgi:hypothetical protein
MTIRIIDHQEYYVILNYVIIVGYIIAKEMSEALQLVGIDFNPKLSLSLMKTFGVEKPGYMNLKEFIMLLDQVTKDVDQRRKNLSGQYIMTLVPIDNNSEANNENKNNDTNIRDESGRNYSGGLLEIPIRYVPPSTGILFLKSMNSVLPKPLHKVGKLCKI